jgi:hypothetical protein
MRNEKLSYQPNKTRLFAEDIAWLTKFSQFYKYLAKNGNTEIDEIMKTELNTCMSRSYKRTHSDKFRLVHKYVK